MGLTYGNIAAICHEANRIYCMSIGDDTQPHWQDAPEWQRSSALEGVLKIVEGEVRQPSDSHTSWLAHKTAEGWVYGELKDESAKTHPCCVPFEELSEEQKFKDTLFFNLASTLLAL